MQLFVPVYRTEAGVHTQNPPVQAFNTLATVSGSQVAKPGVEVLIKWVGAAWVEQSAYSAGTVAATKTFNPETSTYAYLYIPINDYNAVSQCCATTSGAYAPPGAGGGTGGGRVQWDSGIIVDPEDVHSEVLTLEIDDMVALAPFGVYISSGLQVDWGDGNIREYADGVLAIRTFADAYDGNILIYHTGVIENLTVQDDAGGFRGIITSISGDLPTGLKTVQIANNLPAIPAFAYAAVKTVNLSNTALDAAELNGVLDLLIAAGLNSGSLSILTNPRVDADITKLNTLKARGWSVQAYGVYPNL